MTYGTKALRLSHTHSRLLDALQKPMSRREVATAIEAHPTYCARALKALVDEGLVELVPRTAGAAYVYRAKVKMLLVAVDPDSGLPMRYDGTDISTAPLADGAQDTGN